MQNNEYGDTLPCWSNHLGLWCVEPLWFAQAAQAVRLGMWSAETRPPRIEAAEPGRRPYALTPGGVAIIPLMGPLMKGESKFGGTSTVMARRDIRLALRDDGVKSIALHIDSPGGHVAGTQALADEVAAADRIKPVLAHVDDLAASAAYWIASQARRITANRTAEVGSIGTVAVLADSSGRMDRLGIRVHVISTGAYKGLGVDGAPVTAEGLDYLQTRVDGLNEHFLTAVAQGRRMRADQLDNIADGRVFVADEARRLGLVDAIGSLDDALGELGAAPASGVKTYSLAMAQARLARRDTVKEGRQK